jgi:D-sedoheptulose 7-phosphate isomerase
VQTASTCASAIVRAVDLIASAFEADGKLLLCGNGGSAADCQHVAAEFVVRLTSAFDRPGLPAIALTTDSSVLTAYSNDFDFDGVFARQVQAIGRAGDVLLAISTSGGSRNVVQAVSAAKVVGLKVVALTAEHGILATMADVSIEVPSRETQHVQEAHLAIEHVICHLVERRVTDRLAAARK